MDERGIKEEEIEIKKIGIDGGRGFVKVRRHICCLLFIMGAPKKVVLLLESWQRSTGFITIFLSDFVP